MKLTWNTWPGLAVMAAGLLLIVNSGASAQSPKTKAKVEAPPTATGKAVAYEADKSITVEVRQRGGQSKSLAFAIVKDKTKVELLGTTKTIEVGTEVRVWAEEDDAKTAARITAGTMRMPGGRAPAKRPDVPPKAGRAKVEPDKEADKQATKGTARSAREKNKSAGNPQAPPAVARAIDQEIQRVLDTGRIRASGQADDAEFIRRIYLDITGRIPPPEKAAAFVASTDPDKRSRLIDELLASPEYGLHFAELWCDRIDVKDLPIYREPFIGWLADGLNEGRGWDDMVFDLLTAEGSFNFITRGRRLSSTDPQALFVLLNTEEGMGKGPNPAWLAAESGRLFLGVQLQCAECHNHPFTESWKQTDFWGLAAFFGQLRSERVAQGGLHWKETPVAADKSVSVIIPPTALKNIGKTVPARLPGADEEYKPGEEQLLRRSLARWMTSAENPFFAKAAVNRMWAHFFGRGLVNPVDDLRPDNLPTHPAILDSLADEFKKSGFDFKYLVRCICLSQAYQRTSVPLRENEQYAAKYSHMAVKVIGPGVFYDCLKIATGFPELKVGLPERKTKLTVLTQFTPREVFVDFFRSSQGEEANSQEYTHGIPQALKLMNAAQLNGVAPVVQRLVGMSLGRDQVIEQLYWTALSRRPTAKEVKLIADFLARRNDARPEWGYNAVLWTLINSAEFVSNR